MAQWRELNSIFKKQDKHILINYIYNYNKRYLKNYAIAVMGEMFKRNYDIKQMGNYDKYFNHDNYQTMIIAQGNEKYQEHNEEYLTICYYNLKEKYLRGQKDFTKEIWENLEKFYKEIKL